MHAYALKSALATVASKLAFWRAQGRCAPLSVGTLVCGGQKAFLAQVGTTEQEWAAFQASYFGAADWHHLCARHGLEGDTVVAGRRKLLKQQGRK